MEQHKGEFHIHGVAEERLLWGFKKGPYPLHLYFWDQWLRYILQAVIQHLSYGSSYRLSLLWGHSLPLKSPNLEKQQRVPKLNNKI